MVRKRSRRRKGDRQGDTLVEVTFALAILSAVLIGATAVATSAFRTGQTAKERTQVATAAQGQVEALRNFRDNHTWTQFRSGNGAQYSGVDLPGASCVLTPGQQCFHMVASPTTPGVTEWVPQAGATSANVPGSIIEIYTETPAVSRPCGYNFILKYQFPKLGNDGTASNRIVTKLTNLSFNAGEFRGVPCP